MVKKDCPPGFTPTSNYEYIVDCFVPEVVVPTANGCAPPLLPDFEPIPRFPCPVFTGDVTGDVRYVAAAASGLTGTLTSTTQRNGTLCRTDIDIVLDLVLPKPVAYVVFELTADWFPNNACAWAVIVHDPLGTKAVGAEIVVCKAPRLTTEELYHPEGATGVAFETSSGTYTVVTIQKPSQLVLATICGAYEPPPPPDPPDPPDPPPPPPDPPDPPPPPPDPPDPPPDPPDPPDPPPDPPDPPPAATGACCINGTCFMLTAAECSAAGGEYLGDNVNCAFVFCNQNPPPTGICCLPSGGVIMTEAECAAAGGIWGGPGSTEQSFPCATSFNQLPPPPDAELEASLLGTLWGDDPSNLFDEVIPPANGSSGPLKAKDFAPLHTQDENVFPYDRTRCYRIQDPLNLSPAAGDRVLLSFDISRAVPPPVNPPRTSDNHVMPYIVIAVYPAATTFGKVLLKKP